MLLHPETKKSLLCGFHWSTMTKQISFRRRKEVFLFRPEGGRYRTHPSYRVCEGTGLGFAIQNGPWKNRAKRLLPMRKRKEVQILLH